MAAINKSIYEELILESNDQKRTIDIRQGTVSIDYYEDIFSPTITAKIRVVNTGDTIQAPDKEGNPDGERQSIYNGLPLRGGERVSLKIRGNSDKNPGLDFASNQKDYLYVSSITDIVSESQRETFLLHLTSREAITNETSRVGKKYPTSSTIDASVTDILKNYLKTEKIGKIDKTQNKYGFIGNLRKPFTVLVWLAAKGVPAEISGDATAGFVFYQTKEGFQFRSIDSLISQKPDQIPTYTYTNVNESGKTRDNDFAILNYKTEKNQNLIEKLRLGSYASYRMFYNPLTFEFTDPQKGTFTTDDYVSGVKNLGQQLQLPKISNDSNIDLGHIPTRFLTQVLDIGTLEKDVSIDVNSDPFKYQSQAIMRYNMLFTQTLSIVVGSNTNLKAGDIIKCNFPKISRGDVDEYDKEQSGLYMIKELCHHFDSQASYTSMKLIRDTFGTYGTNDK
jgi:hypothetical protein